MWCAFTYPRAACAVGCGVPVPPCRDSLIPSPSVCCEDANGVPDPASGFSFCQPRVVSSLLLCAAAPLFLANAGSSTDLFLSRLKLFLHSSKLIRYSVLFLSLPPRRWCFFLFCFGCFRLEFALYPAGGYDWMIGLDGWT